MLFRLYSLSIVEDAWKIAEVDVMRCAVSAESFQRLLHIMVGWTEHSTRFLLSPSAAPTPQLSPSIHLLPRKGSNVVVLGEKIFKSFD